MMRLVIVISYSLGWESRFVDSIDEDIEYLDSFDDFILE